MNVESTAEERRLNDAVHRWMGRAVAVEARLAAVVALCDAEETNPRHRECLLTAEVRAAAIGDAQ